MDEPFNERIPLPFLRWRGFTIRIFLLTVLPATVIILVIVFLSQYLHLREMRMMVADRNLRSVRLAADNLAHQLREKREILLLHEISTTQNTEITGLEGYFDLGLAVLDPQSGKLRPLSSAFPPIDLEDRVIDLWLADPPNRFPQPLTVQSGEEHVTLIPVTTGDGQIMIGVFNPHQLIQNAVRDLLSAASVTVWVEDLNQQILYQGTTTASLSPTSPLDTIVHDHGSNMNGIHILPDLQGDHVLSYAPVTGSDWVIIYEETWGNIASPLINTTFYAPLILIPLLVIAVIALWFGARQIIYPLQKLQNQSQLLGKGDFQSIEKPVGGIEEIQQLQNQLILVSRELQHVQGNLHQYIGSLTAGVENERKNLARELHDDTLQSLIALQQRVQLAEIQQQSNRQDTPNLEELKDVIQKSIHSLRRLVRGLRPAYLDDFGLVSAVKTLVDEMQDVQIRVLVEGEELRLPSNVELAFYRIAQEALSNIIRHAQANQATVRFIFLRDSIQLQIEDDGIGFEMPSQADAFASAGHFGLLGMAERADLVGAKLEIRSQPGEGTLVEIEFIQQA